MIAAGLFLGFAAAPASAQNVVPLAEGVTIEERSSNPARLYGLPGANVFLPAGAILNLRDIQGGTWVPGLPSLLNLDIGAGNPENPGILNLGADVSRMVRVQNGQHRTVLSTRSYGVAVLGRLRVCSRGCVDVMRLERRVARLEAALRRLLRARARGG